MILKREVTALVRSGRKRDSSFLKALMVILPIIIIGIVVFALIAVFKQYLSLSADTDSQNDNAAVETKKDESKLLLLISPDFPLSSDYKTDLVSFEDIEVARVMLNDLKELTEAASKAQVALRLDGGYVSPEEQHELYMNEVRRLISAEGMTDAKARKEAEKTVPMENHSEQQSGLSVVFSSALTADFSESEEYNWLCRSCMNYGFVLRYPKDKESATGRNYDPTCFRYVGRENAVKMTTFNMTLDEYVNYLDSRK